MIPITRSTGMRQGELLALKRDDLERGVLRVRRTLTLGICRIY